MSSENLVKNTQIVVLMGGLGTRLGLKDCPKALADVNGRPFFDYQLKLLKRWGFHKFLFLVGYQAERVEKYYGDGSDLGIEICYSHDGKEQLGTGGALRKAWDLLEDQFLLIYGDSFLDIDYQETIYRYYAGIRHGMEGVMTVLCNENRLDKSNVVYENKELVLYDKINYNNRMRYIDYGVSMISKKAFGEADADNKFDLAELFNALSIKGTLAGQEVTKRFYEIGSPASLNEFREYAKGRFEKVHPAIFFDRDGVINELTYNDDIEQLDSPFTIEEFQYLDGILDVMRQAGRLGFYIFIVTNQPAAAKGKVRIEKLYDLNTWLVKDLKEKGIEVECVNVCPHYPTDNPRTDSRFLIQKCECRKPKPALITDLYSIYNLNLGRSFMIGDSYTDVMAGADAGVRTVLLGALKCDMCKRLKDKKPDLIIENIGELSTILKEE